jgi:hypothetical protein
MGFERFLAICCVSTMMNKETALMQFKLIEHTDITICLNTYRLTRIDRIAAVRGNQASTTFLVPVSAPA